MSKGKRRKKEQMEARDRREQAKVGGGTSKYAKKRAASARGKPSKNSPFYVSPEQEARALACGAGIVDAEGRPVRVIAERDAEGYTRIVERVIETTPEEEKQVRLTRSAARASSGAAA